MRILAFLYLFLKLLYDLAADRKAISFAGARRWLGKRWLLAGIPTVVTWVLVMLLWMPPPVSFQNPHSLYLLSASVQSLATILALVATISVVMAQVVLADENNRIARQLRYPSSLAESIPT